MEFGYIVGWVGLSFCVAIPLPQLIKSYRTKSVNDLTPLTFVLICGWLICSFTYALIIKDLMFSIAQGYGLAINGAILALVLKYRKKE